MRWPPVCRRLPARWWKSATTGRSSRPRSGRWSPTWFPSPADRRGERGALRALVERQVEARVVLLVDGLVPVALEGVLEDHRVVGLGSILGAGPLDHPDAVVVAQQLVGP